MKYGIVPWKLILNVLLVIAVTCLVVITNTQESNYIQAASRNFYYFFYPSNYDFSDPVWYTYTVNDTVSAVSNAVSNYYAINDISPDTFGYEYGTAPDGSRQPLAPTLTVTSYTDVQALFGPVGTFTGATQTASYTLNSTYLGPLDYNYVNAEAMQSFFTSLVTMTLTIPPLHNFAFGTLYRNCLVWQSIVTYDFTNRGQIQLTMDQNVLGTCDTYASPWAAFASKGLWLNFLVIALSLLHTSLLLKAILRSLILMRRLRNWAQERAKKLRAALAAQHQVPVQQGAAVHGISQTTTAGLDDGSTGTGNGTTPATGTGTASNLTAQAPMVPNSVNMPALTRQASVRPGSAPVRVDFRTDMDVDGTGDIFITTHTTGGAGAGSGGMSLQGMMADSQAGGASTGRGIARGKSSTGMRAVTTTHMAPGDDDHATGTGTGEGGSSSGQLLGSLASAATAVVFGPAAVASAGTGSGAGNYTALRDEGDGQHASTGTGTGNGDYSGLSSPSPSSASATGVTASASEPTDPAYLAAQLESMEALSVTWQSLSLRDKLRFINGWALLSIAADACNIVSCSLNLANRTSHIPSDDTHATIMACGLALLWMGVLRYMEHNRTYFNIVLTLRRASPRVLRFLVGVLPIFIAYALFAMVVWGDRVPRFCDVRTSFITLFANLNGDVVRETFMAMVGYSPITAQFFFYSFIALHIYVVLNIIIAVVEESYFITVQKTEDMEVRLHEEEERAKRAAKVEQEGSGGGEGGSGFGVVGRLDHRGHAHTVAGAAAGSANAHQAALHGRTSGAQQLPVAASHPQSSPHSHASGHNGGGASSVVPSSAASTTSSGGGGTGSNPPASVFGGATGTGSTVISSSGGGGIGGSVAGGIDLLHTAAKTDSNSLKERPDSKLHALLRLSEWDEVLTGSRIGASGRPTSVSAATGISSSSSTASAPPSARSGPTGTGSFNAIGAGDATGPGAHNAASGGGSS